MTILSSGSLAFDRLASYSGLFSESFLRDKLDILNAAFLVDSVERVHGGTAGNIAYTLTLLGEKPLVISSLGGDPDGRDYLKRLTEWGLDLSAVTVDPALPTSGAYIATDRASSQLIFFNPGAMASESPFHPETLPGDPKRHLAMISPGCLKDMTRLAESYRRLGTPFIFDPGQQISAFSGEELRGMLAGSEMLITNEYELDLFLWRTMLSAAGLFGHTKAVLTTLGEKGSRLAFPERAEKIAASPAKSVANPTGAGDAYRAGLLKGLTSGLSLLWSCRLGSATAAFCVESPGTQGHSFTLQDVLDRCQATFGERPPLSG
jgi:adenosine kinase